MIEMKFENGPGWRVAGRGRRHGRGRERLRDLFDEQPPRADRGAVRFLVLDALREAPRHGYEIMAAIETKTQGSYRPSPGVVYPTLQLLEELGHVRVSVKDDKKVYALTAAGTKELDEHGDEVASFYEQTEGVWQDHGDELFELAHLVRKMMRTVRRAARRGRLTATKAAKLRAIMQDTVGKLEALFEE
jgi:DNA-binding PadR family transcriptional regulator